MLQLKFCNEDKKILAYPASNDKYCNHANQTLKRSLQGQTEVENVSQVFQNLFVSWKRFMFK